MNSWKGFTMKRLVSIVTVTLIVISTVIAYAEKVIPWREAHKYYGKKVTVEGKIVSTYNSDKACFLNFHTNWRKYFTAVIFAPDFDKFPSNPEDYFQDKKVQVTGVVKEYEGKPEIILKNPSQIKVIDLDKPPEKLKVISWMDAHKYYGEKVVVEGTVVASFNSGKACFLNFHSNWKKYFTAVIFQSALDKFPKQPEIYYRGKKVQVTGTVKECEGKPEIILTQPSQINIIDSEDTDVVRISARQML